MSSAIELLRAQYGQAFGWLEGAMNGVTDEVAHYKPDGAPSPIAGQVAHIVTGVDFFLLGMGAGQPPLMMGEFAGKSGVSEPPPQGGWGEWGDRVQVDLPQIHEYAKAVFAAVDAFLATLTDDDLDRQIEFGPAGPQTLAWGFNIMLLNTYSHTGEISCIKGLQDLKGYAM